MIDHPVMLQIHQIRLVDDGLSLQLEQLRHKAAHFHKVLGGNRLVHGCFDQTGIGELHGGHLHGPQGLLHSELGLGQQLLVGFIDLVFDIMGGNVVGDDSDQNRRQSPQHQTVHQ
ncbi:hypothetical protein D3C75_650530 [compost metagenome]